MKAIILIKINKRQVIRKSLKKLIKNQQKKADHKKKVQKYRKQQNQNKIKMVRMHKILKIKILY